MTRHLATLRESYRIPLVRTSSESVVPRLGKCRSVRRTSPGRTAAPRPSRCQRGQDADRVRLRSVDP
eukprot:scaffold2971_cov1256-Pavlova_lutheri.AAC.2